MSTLIHTDVLIQAPIAMVWQTLVQLDAYHVWNPLYVRAHGKIAPGERLQLETVIPGRGRFTFTPVVYRYRQGASFSWVGQLGHRRLLRAEHRFELVRVGVASTVLIQEEAFDGLGSTLALKLVQADTRRSFERMHGALRQRVESQYQFRRGHHRAVTPELSLTE